MKFTVIGAGRWATFISWYLTKLGLDVTEWGRPTSRAFMDLVESRKNEYLALPDSIKLTCDLEAAVRDCDMLIIAAKSEALREICTGITEILGQEKKPLIICMKGIEAETGLRLTEVAMECGFDKDKLAVWVGPGHIQEFLQGNPNCMLIDGYNKDFVSGLVDLLRSDLIRFYIGDDIIGTEIGAAAKNVMGIVAGVLDGCGMTSLKGPLMARGAREVARLIDKMGGNQLSAYGLCHLGDYETTLFSPHSHNRTYGMALARGEKFEKLAEGVNTTAAMKRLGEKYSVELPITESLYNVIYLGGDPRAELGILFSRKTKKEFY